MQHTILFIRNDHGWNKVAIVTINTHRNPMTALAEAVSSWVDETPEGRKLLEYTCNDLNIGDLAEVYEDIPMIWWERAGITSIEIRDILADYIRPYDTILYQEKSDEDQ